MNDYESIQKRRNVIVGIFVVIAMCALVWLIFIFGDLPTAWSKLRSFNVSVQFPQAPGVEQNTPVRFTGYQIGSVVAVEPPRKMRDLLTGKEMHQTIVVIAIDKQFANIPSNVEAKLITRGLGSSYIQFVEDPEKPLTMSDPNNPASVYLMDGVHLQGSMGVSSEFFPEASQKKLEQLVDSMKTLIDNTNMIIGDSNNQANVKATLANLSDATKQATATLRQLEKFSSTGTESLAMASKDVSNVANALVETSLELNKTVVEFEKVLQKVNSGQGTAGRFINDASLYENLLDSSLELHQAIEELKLLVAQTREKGLTINWKLW